MKCSCLKCKVDVLVAGLCSSCSKDCVEQPLADGGCPKCGYQKSEIQIILPMCLGLLFATVAQTFESSLGGPVALVGALIGFWIEYRRVRKERLTQR